MITRQWGRVLRQRVAPGGFISVAADSASGDSIDAIPIVSLDEEVRALGLVP